MRNSLFCLLLLGAASLQFAQEKPAAPSKKIFSIDIAMPADAIATELEFSEIDLARASREQLAQARTKVIRTLERTYREYVAPEFRFFRVRSVHKTGIPGAYGETHTVSAYLRDPYREPRLPLVQQGQTEYLQGSSIELPQQAGMVTRYRIDEGDFLDYQGPLQFGKPGTYRIEIKVENEAKEVVLMRTYYFKVEVSAPVTRAVISNPVHGRQGIQFGKDSALLFFATDGESGVAKTFYRLVPIGQKSDDKSFREYAKRLSYGEVAAGGEIHLLQYYSVDVAGNKEEIRSELIQCETGP